MLIIASSALAGPKARGCDLDHGSPECRRKPPMLVIVALANKTALIAWALIRKADFIELQPSVPDCGERK